ncbi:MAG: prolipoprotein diacylglyceryl transferase [Desulfobacteraceae bacterium]|nr:prolipoprotein diacylglyceryl transferase [Desulfobacteraceae bacterium]MBC2756927.1 prolipoprotein diacylglyceryl transferase [Desulfobacteraceae bacterium]
MYPVLLKFGELITIHTYGFFIALAVLAGMFIARYEAKRLGIDPDKVVDACFYVVVAAIVGSRLLYVFTNIEFFMSAPLEVFKIWNGGLVFYGGFIASAAVLIAYLKIYRLPLGKMADIAALALPLGHSLGRIGCFFAGCCYGKICHQPWAITFRHPDSLAPVFVPLHPTQLYSSGSNFFIFLLIFFFRRFKKYDGQLFWIYFAFYGINRSIIEVFRGDFRGTTVFNTFSISQVIGLSSALIAVIMLIILGRKN